MTLLTSTAPSTNSPSPEAPPAVGAPAQPEARSALEDAVGRGGFDPTTFKFRKYGWLAMARRSGREGDEWATEFMTTPLPTLILWSTRALEFLRKHEVEEGRELLLKVQRHMADLEAQGGDLPLMVPRRWTLGILAYLHYLDRRYDEALDTLDRAESAVCEVVATYPFLAELAMVGRDFAVQRARVYRCQREWVSCLESLEAARGMIRGDVALLRLGDGRKVFVHDVVGYFRSLDLNAEEHEALDYYFDPERNLVDFTRQTNSLGVPPGFVVPY
ncbi:MAG: hypothetical protein AAGM22_09245 [Acidobacteriota bacterium]